MQSRLICGPPFTFSQCLGGGSAHDGWLWLLFARKMPAETPALLKALELNLRIIDRH